MKITSNTNPKIKQIITWQKKAKSRTEQGIFIVEGIRMFREIPREQILEVYVSETFLQQLSGKEVAKQYEVIEVSDSVFAHMTQTQTPQGILAVVKQNQWTLEQLLTKSKNPLFLVIENIQDPGNLGTMLRSGEAAGITGIIASKGTVDLYNPKTVRSTMGSIFRVPMVYTEDLPRTIRQLQQEGIVVYAAHLEGAVSYDELDYTNPSAILIGNEGNGLSEEAANASDRRIKIPMEGQVESLNAAISSAVFLYEAHRQRSLVKIQ
jgi:TrmH family RNA methyltransferase